MSKKRKILCVILAVIFIAAIVSTAIRGLKVNISYAEGTTIVFDIGKQFENEDVKKIAKEIWSDSAILVQKVEVYDESVAVKVPGFTEEQLTNFINKINEKYELELTNTDLTILYNSNEKLRDIVRPYIIPLIIATGLIVVYYSMRFKGVKEILQLLLTLIGVEGIIYSIYALFMFPIDIITMPIVMMAYAGVVIYVTIKSETKKKRKKSETSKKVKEEDKD